MRKMFGFRRNSVEPLHTVTHREIGDIPGLIRAPRSGTWVNTSVAEAQAITAKHAEAFCKVLESGDMYAIKGFTHPMFGPYGERL